MTVLACDALEWRSSNPADPFPVTGCDIPVTFATNGVRTITVLATDTQGAIGGASVVISVVDPPPDLPPIVQVLSPPNNAVVSPTQLLTLNASATDPEGASPLASEWTVTYPYDQATGTGPTTTVIGSSLSMSWTPSDTIPFLGCDVDFFARLRLTVTDPGGAIGADFSVVRIQRIC